ncbi:hypothetical protein REPUB_Repub05bG0038500 [Reevesia pubescens]
MAEAIPYGIMSNILYKLGSDAFQEVVSIFSVRKDFEKLQETLGSINAVLLDAEEKQESSHGVRNWISRLQEVVYDADDLVDEFEYEHLRQKLLARGQVHKFFSISSNPLAFGLRMSNRIKDIRKRLDEIAADKSKFDLREIVLGDMRVKNSGRETAPILVRSVVIGREQNKEDIIELLLQQKHNQEDHNNISIVAIVGLGGLGKTTLAQLVYNDSRIENYFNSRIWVCVSEEFDVKVIFMKILESVMGQNVGDLALGEIQKQLEENLREKRYLLVLDDVWNEEAFRWDDFSKYLVEGAVGSKILVTTRSQIVASTMGVNCRPYSLEGLNEDQSWVLFEQVAFEGQDNNKIDPNLKVIGKDLALRCKGVPLAINCLGSLMRQKPSEQYWSYVKENKIWKLLAENDGVFPVLKLSYIHLPSHLKQCFAFCSIFPKDFEIDKEMLIQMWRAQGYINENIRNIGDEYFNDLLSRSFFQEEERDEKGNIVYCKMHDLIHDLAQLVAGSSFLMVKDDKQKIQKGVHHVLLECTLSKELLRNLSSKTERVRTLLLKNENLQSVELQNIIFSSFSRSLRILRLNFLKINILSNKIGKLKQLRFLDLSNNPYLRVLPNSITNLHNLQTLKLYFCSSLEKLPIDIGKLINLQYLDIEHCFELKCLPKGLGELTSLQQLSRFILSRDSTAATLNELSELNSLGGKLVIENLEKVRNDALESNKANLKEKKYLQSLILRWNENGDDNERLLDNLEPHPNLISLIVIGYKGARFSSWLSSISNLVRLKLQNNHCQYLPPLDHLPSLKYLSLVYFYNLEYMTDDDSRHDEQASSLSCSSTITTITTTNIFFPSLEELRLEYCPNLKGWWKRKNTNEGSTAVLPSFPCLSLLNIINCPCLTSIPLFPSLNQELYLKKCSLRPLLQTMTMKMEKSSITSAASSSITSHSSATLPLSNLKRLILSSIDDLEVHLEEFPHCRFTSLQHLGIYSCPNLIALPDWIPNLTTLQTFHIEGCGQLQTLPEGICLLTLETFHIEGCGQLQTLPEGMHLLTSLQSLTISNCPSLSALLDWLPNLPSLKELKSRYCPELIPSGRDASPYHCTKIGYLWMSQVVRQYPAASHCSHPTLQRSEEERTLQLNEEEQNAIQYYTKAKELNRTKLDVRSMPVGYSKVANDTRAGNYPSKPDHQGLLSLQRLRSSTEQSWM